MQKTKLITIMAMLTAIGVVGSTYLWFPAGVAKAFPVQHAINVITAVWLGPGPAIMVAFLIAVIRNILGIGTLLAFPGGMIGAWLAGWLFRKTQKRVMAGIGEILGTGLIGSLLSVPLAIGLMGQKVGAFAFLLPFLISSLSGTLLAFALLSLLKRMKLDHLP